MGIEIERKYLVRSDAWRDQVRSSTPIVQGYLSNSRRASVRVRLKGEAATLNIKGMTIGARRAEFEYAIPLADARAMLDELCPDERIEKTRHLVEHGGLTWEVDEFAGRNDGLVVAEVELDSEDQAVDLPAWAGEEVTEDPRYYNVMLVAQPYDTWCREPAPLELRVDLGRQELMVVESGTVTARYSVSTARNGPGEMMDSECTPRGRHVVRARIGDGLPGGAVFRARRPTGEVWSEALSAAHPDRDWILSRILWLSGCEPGRNRLGRLDSMRRYIYIHGTPDTEPMGVPASHGCIRMRNDDVIALFDRVPAGTPIDIRESWAGL